MELLYIESLFTTHQFETESYHFYLNYIIGEKTYMHSHIGFAKFVLKNYKKFSIHDYVRCYETYYILLGSIENTIDEDEFKSNDRFLNEIKNINNIKKKRQISSDELRIIRNFNSYYNEIKNGLLDKCKVILKFANIEDNLDLIDEDIFHSDFSYLDREYNPIDTNLSKIIYENILSKEKLIVEVSTYKKISDVLNEVDDNKDLIRDFDRFIMPEFPLFVFPISKQISNETLLILRKQFNPIITILLSKIQNFRLNSMDCDINESLAKKFLLFYISLILDIKSIQDEIDNNIYFQKIKNSDAEYENVEVCIGVNSSLVLLGIYSSIRAITHNTVLALFKDLQEHNNIIKGDIFIYYNVKSDNLNEDIDDDLKKNN